MNRDMKDMYDDFDDSENEVRDLVLMELWRVYCGLATQVVTLHGGGPCHSFSSMTVDPPSEVLLRIVTAFRSFASRSFFDLMLSHGQRTGSNAIAQMSRQPSFLSACLRQLLA
jgi:hypothetical protein